MNEENLIHPGDIVERVDNGRRLAPIECAPPLDHDNPPIDTVARERAEGWISDFAQKLAEAEAALATISGFIGDGSAGTVPVGRAGIKIGEAREEIPALRQAVRAMERES